MIYSGQQIFERIKVLSEQVCGVDFEQTFIEDNNFVFTGLLFDETNQTYSYLFGHEDNEVIALLNEQNFGGHDIAGAISPLRFSQMGGLPNPILEDKLILFIQDRFLREADEEELDVILLHELCHFAQYSNDEVRNLFCQGHQLIENTNQYAEIIDELFVQRNKVYGEDMDHNEVFTSLLIRALSSYSAFIFAKLVRKSLEYNFYRGTVDIERSILEGVD